MAVGAPAAEAATAVAATAAGPRATAAATKAARAAAQRAAARATGAAGRKVEGASVVAVGVGDRGGSWAEGSEVAEKAEPLAAARVGALRAARAQEEAQLEAKMAV